jgi:hypothetical protein
MQALVDKALPPEFSHIRGLRDVVECRFFANPAPRPGRDDLIGLETWAPFSCPVAGVEMNGRYPFVVLRRRAAAAGSGGAEAEARDDRVTVLSEKALKEVGLAALQAEFGPVREADVIKLVPSDAERASMVAALDARRATERAAKAEAKLAKTSAKAEAKKDKGKRKAEVGDDQGGSADVSADEAQDKDKDERRAAKRAAKLSKEQASRSAGVAQNHGASVGEARAAALTGAVKHEAAAALKAAQALNPSLKALFHGAGSQKPESAQFQFICQAGKKMGGTCS